MFENLVPPPLVVQWWQRPDLILSGLGVFVALLTLACVLVQLRLERRQTRLAEEQTRLARAQIALSNSQGELVEEQHRIIKAQLAIAQRQLDITTAEHMVAEAERRRRAEFFVTTERERRHEDELRIVFLATNRGTKAASWFTWHLWFPSTISLERGVWDPMGAVKFTFEEEQVPGTQNRSRHYTDRIVAPTLEESAVKLAMMPIKLSNLTSDDVVFWKVETIDGVDPRDTGVGAIELLPVRKT